MEMGRVREAGATAVSLKITLSFPVGSSKSVVHRDDTNLCFALADRNPQRNRQV